MSEIYGFVHLLRLFGKILRKLDKNERINCLIILKKLNCQVLFHLLH